MQLSRFSFIAAVAVLLPGNLREGWALGYEVPNQGARAVARGNAFVATADDASAVYYNPAGITQMKKGLSLMGGSYNVYLHSEYESPLGRGAETDFRIVPVPHAYAVYKTDKLPVTIGVGVNNSYGLKLSWPEDSGFRTLSTSAQMQYISMSTVVAYEPLPGLSLAIGPTVNYSTVQLKSGLFPYGVGVNDEFSFDGSGWDFGFTAGALWKLHEQWSVGFNYRSGTSVKYDGDLQLRPVAPIESADGTLNFPDHFSFGVSFRPTPQWNLEFNIDYIDWDDVADVQIHRPDNPAAPMVTLPFDYKSGFMYKFGATYDFGNGLSLSGGYFFTDNAVEDVNYNPSVPDTDLHAFSVGGAYNYKSWTYSLAYQYITGPWNNVSGSTPSPAGESADGRYKYQFHTLTLSVAYHF